MKLYYDFHIHTGLSPCGSNDMTPNNIVNMALIKELDCIAVTDHNSCGNARVVTELGEEVGLLVIPGMELETSEEVHNVCLFKSIDAAEAFAKAVNESLPKIKNRVEIFGDQLYFDENDDEIGRCDNLLVTATTLDLFSAKELVRSHDGILIPAHVDRSSYSVLSNLGFIPPELGVSLIELSKNCNPEDFLDKNKRGLMGVSKFITSSDAHYLEHINERSNFLELPLPDGEKPTRDFIIEYLLSLI